LSGSREVFVMVPSCVPPGARWGEAAGSAPRCGTWRKYGAARAMAHSDWSRRNCSNGIEGLRDLGNQMKKSIGSTQSDGIAGRVACSQPDITFDEGFQNIRRELKSFAGVDAAEAPPTFRGQLHEYQRRGSGMASLSAALCIWRLSRRRYGTGKTVQVLCGSGRRHLIRD
jgi:hypothetical protein